MTEFPEVTFIEEFLCPVTKVSRLLYPKGFKGKIPRDHYAAALEAGVLEVPKNGPKT